MATTIQIKRSSTASGVPLAADLAVGELAVNLADKRLFTKQSDGTIIELSTNPTDLDAATLRIDGVEITASATELNKLDGFTGSTAELNLLDGLTATTIELNTLDGITASTAELNKLDGYTGSTAELNILDGVTATTAELNKLDGFTGSVDDLNYAKDLRATGVTTAELDVLDGITATTTELNYTDGVTSNIQTQLDGKATSAQGALADSAVQPDDNVSFGTGSFSGAVDVTGTVTADGLGIGTASPSLFVGDGLVIDKTISALSLQNGSGNAQGFDLLKAGDDGYIINRDNGNIRIHTNNTERARIDSSGNLLVGKTSSSDPISTGHVFYEAGTAWHTAENTYPLFLNRESSDGELIRFRKDNTSVGSIGSYSGDMYIGNDDVGLLFNNASNYMTPHNAGTNAPSDGTMDIGASSRRFKDLYLSGDANVGGTVTADGLTVDGDTTVQSAQPKFVLKETDVVDQNTRLRNTVGDFQIQTINDAFTVASNRLTIDHATGDVSFYEDTGTTAKMMWDASAEGLELSSLTSYVVTNSGKALGGLDIKGAYSGLNTYGAGISLGTGGTGRSAIAAVAQHASDNDSNGLAFFIHGSSGSTADSSEAMRIDSSGNVGIGTSSPSVKLEVDVGTQNIAQKLKSSDDGCYLQFNDNNATGYYLGARGGSFVINNTANSERARIDSSGNLLVGTTDRLVADGTGTGLVLGGQSDLLHVSRSGGDCAKFNRVSNDGSIVTFAKNGTSVGSIGTKDGYLTAGNSDAGLLFLGSGQKRIQPWSVSTNSGVDGQIDLGYSTERFKDLYLSGVAYSNYVGSASDTNTNIAFDNADVIRFTTGAAERMRIDSNGNVGIGTASPSAKLDVEGTSPTIRISDTNTSSNWPDNQEMGRLEFFSQDSSGNSPYGTAYISAVNGLGGGTLASGELAFGTTAYNASGGAIERMRLTDEGYLGIGTASPSHNLQVVDATESTFRVNQDGTGASALQITAGNAYTSINSTKGGQPLTFGTQNTERARLDSSGNLLVGTTDAAVGVGNTNTGHSFGASGYASISRTGAASQSTLFLNKNTNDGSILEFRKNGSTVGSIGTNLSRLHIGSDDCRLFFDAGSTNAVWPWAATATSSGDADNTIDLGDSENRFKDLYLSGGVYLGGTGAANKLDDYEEGIWTPTVEGNTTAGTYVVTPTSCRYTKVGRLVTVTGKLEISVTTGGTGAAKFGGLPFISSGNSLGQGGVRIRNITTTAGLNLTISSWTSNTTYFAISISRNGTSSANTQADELNSASIVELTYQYETNS